MTHLSHTYARQAAGVRALADVLRQYPELRTLEAAVVAEGLAEFGATPPDALDRDAADLAEEAGYKERTAEADRRAAVAGTRNRLARCVCSHSGVRHARRLTEDGRIPCATDGCRCPDLAYAPA
ncbi:hypothetical protein ACN20G_28060 (plasmid) [Streptomyces sp. BI20]|uniref:hypothetical protein n=1 Tax=Streptomyces sp. BI20 TaxID=3403460 RepID=UPI003C76CB8B